MRFLVFLVFLICFGCLQTPQEKEVPIPTETGVVPRVWETTIPKEAPVEKPIPVIARPGIKNALDCTTYEAWHRKSKPTTYSCFEIYEEDPQSTINRAKNVTTNRVIFYGSYVLYDCPAKFNVTEEDIITSCFVLARFVDGIEHPLIASYLNVTPQFSYHYAHPISFVILDTKEELARICTKENDACTKDGFVFQSASVELLDNRGKTNTILMSEGDHIYVYDEHNPENCPVIETTYHEHTHTFNLALLPPHPEWFEEVLARVIYDGVKEELCDFKVQKSSFREYNSNVIGKIIMENVSGIDRRKINSELPFDYYGEFYADGDTCRNGIIMEINQNAYAHNREYILKLYDSMKKESFVNSYDIAQSLLEISRNKTNAKILLSPCLA